MRIVTWVTTLVVVAGGPICAARAQDGSATIVRIEGDDVFLDAGEERVSVGDDLEVRRTIEVRHPITRRVLRDWFPVGHIRVATVRARLSIARALGTPWRPLAAGDTVVLPPRAPPEPEESPSNEAAATTASESTAPPDGAATSGGSDDGAEAAARRLVRARNRHAAELLAVFERTLGRPPEDRIRMLSEYLSLNADSPYRVFVGQEILALQTWLVTGARLESVQAGTVHWQAIERARVRTPLQIALLLRPESGLRALLLHARTLRRGRVPVVYRTVRMTIDRAGHARARVPDDLLDGDALEYFVEGVSREGRSVPVVGSAPAPMLVDLEPPPGVRPRELDRSRIRVSAEMVDFDLFSGRDWYFLAEADFLYRVRFGLLYGIRVGYGVYRGQGGTVEQLDELGEPPRPAGYTYGYTELELRPFAIFSIIFRATAGLGRPDDASVDQREGLRGGFQVRGRIGRERGTHLLFGAETVPELGQRALLGLAWEVIPNVPMAGEVQVTDQPVAGDLAVRLIYEVGYRVSDAVSLSSRLSYQGRTIDHAGLGGGLAATFDW